MNSAYLIELTKGDCFDLSLTYKAADLPVNLTGYSAEMALSWPERLPSPRGASGLLPYLAGAEALTGVIADPSSGEISFHMEAEETSALPPVGVATYQVRLTDADGHVITILTGRAVIYRDQFEGAE